MKPSILFTAFFLLSLSSVLVCKAQTDPGGNNPQPQMAVSPIKGVGVVIKKNCPKCTSSERTTTGNDGGFNLPLQKGSYLISLSEADGQHLLSFRNEDYVIELVLNDNPGIIMSAINGSEFKNIVAITVREPATLQGSLQWKEKKKPEATTVKHEYVGHVSLIKRTINSQQIFCPAGTIPINGRCISLLDFENTPEAQNADYVGHAKLVAAFTSEMQTSPKQDRYFPHQNPRIEVAINANAAIPNGNNIKQSAGFSPEISISYYPSKNFFIGLSGNHITAKPSFNIDEYAAPFADKGFATITKDNSNFSSTSVLLSAGYTFHLNAKEKGDGAKGHKTAADLSVRVSAGASFNSFPNQTITQNFNGTTETIATYKYTGGGGKAQGIMSTSARFTYWISPAVGLNLSAGFQKQLGSKEFSYSYKDLSNVNFNGQMDVIKFQVHNAPTKTETTKGITGNFSFGAGLTFSISGRDKKSKTYSHQVDRMAADSTKKSKVKDIRMDGTGRTTRPDGTNDSDPRPVKNNTTILNKEKPADTTRVKSNGKRSEAELNLRTTKPDGSNDSDPRPVKNNTTILNKETPKDTTRKSKVKDVKYDSMGRTTKPDGQDDGNPFPPKNTNEKRSKTSEAKLSIGVGRITGLHIGVQILVSGETMNKEKPKDTTKQSSHEYVGHVSLIKREMNPAVPGPDTENLLEPLQELPGQNETITVYSIANAAISSDKKIKETEVPVVYFFYKSEGKTIAIPFLVFDLPKQPTEFTPERKKFQFEQNPAEAVRKRRSEIRFLQEKTAGAPSELNYETSIDNKLSTVKITLVATETIYSGNTNTAETVWCGVSTNCGAVFAVQVPSGTNCASVNSFFNKVCDGLLNNRAD